ncbi:MAG: hypothetical protein JST59_11140 [Actinobacteria bacterium]|nr:hypothetical protein [Actinomycetota bacterium]
MERDSGGPEPSSVKRDSDLALLPFTSLLLLAVLAILAAFFLVGVVVGFVVLVCCVVLGVALFARFIRRNEIG